MKGQIIPDWKVVTDMKGQHASKTTKCVWSVTTAQPQMSYTTAPSQRTHYPALSPCHTMRHYQALSPTARGQQHSKSLLKPAVVVSCCSISSQDCCHHHCTPPVGEAVLLSHWRPPCKLIFTEILISLTDAIKSSKYLFTVYKYSYYKPLFLYCGIVFFFDSIGAYVLWIMNQWMNEGKLGINKQMETDRCNKIFSSVFRQVQIM